MMQGNGKVRQDRLLLQLFMGPLEQRLVEGAPDLMKPPLDRMVLKLLAERRQREAEEESTWQVARKRLSGGITNLDRGSSGQRNNLIALRGRAEKSGIPDISVEDTEAQGSLRAI